MKKTYFFMHWYVIFFSVILLWYKNDIFHFQKTSWKLLQMSVSFTILYEPMSQWTTWTHPPWLLSSPNEPPVSHEHVPHGPPADDHLYKHKIRIFHYNVTVAVSSIGGEEGQMRILTRPQTFQRPVGGNISLPCAVINTGGSLLVA